MEENIKVIGARTHNLKDVSVEIPRNKVVVFTGVSGSGKSSLVFDTIYTEAQRQLIETFSSFARRRMPKLSRPPVEEIRNISTAIVIDQKRMGRNLRSTVGTATEIYTYLRLLFSRAGEPFIGPSFYFGFNNPEGMCKTCMGLGKKIKLDINMLIDREKSIKEGAITHPNYKIGGWFWRDLLGVGLFDGEKKLKDYSDEELNKLLYTKDLAVQKKYEDGFYNKNFEGVAAKLERLYMNNAEDESPEEERNAYTRYFTYSECDECGGSRINERARNVKLAGKTIPELVNMELVDFDKYLSELPRTEVSMRLIDKMRQIAGHLIEIGVGYLSLGRAVATLSGGESQRVKMARQLDCDLIDMMYILDEPSIGLHPKDNSKLIEMLRKLRDKGNSVLVVEHDPDIIKSADWVVDVGPGAGVHGGNILFSGNFDDLKRSKTPTSEYLEKREKLDVKRRRSDEYFEIKDANAHNLKNVSVNIPKGVFVCVTGVAGSGKSSLIHNCFVKKNECVIIDQTPAGKSSRSNPATYIGVFDIIRREFSKATGRDASFFSFNSNGSCEKCKGQGALYVDMSFMEGVKTVCDVCKGKRYKDEVLKWKYKDKSIHEVLKMTVEEAVDFFDNKEVKKRLKVLYDVGLGYLELGQSLSTLSGGESQRIKLANELHKEGQIYVMDEPTTGLHMADTERLMSIINRLVDEGNSVIVIEHNLDVIKKADWIIDLGPEGGKNGGEIIAQGTPEDVALNPRSYTGKYLRDLIG